MPQKDLHGFVVPLSQKLAAEMGYEWIDAELVKEGPGRYLRIYLNKEGGISLDDCERYHRQIQPKLDAVDYDFLEISSPGVDRPLKTDRDFERAINTMVELRLYKPIDSAKTIQGTLVSFDADSIRLLLPSGERTFLRRDVALVKPVIIFDDDGEEDET